MGNNTNTPFFILGSVRSGTTLLRNILRHPPRLFCPEETHIFRWAEPFNSNDFNYINLETETLKVHRSMDKVDEKDFSNALSQSLDRGDFFSHYSQLYQNAQKLDDCRIFDKTPQNVYGLPLIKAYFPDAKIIHIVRNPLNVVASLKTGNEISPQNLIGAINFWKEAVLIINTMKPLIKENLYELKYENLTDNSASEVDALIEFLGEEKVDMTEALEPINPAKDSYKDILEPEEINTVKTHLKDLMALYGYS